MTINIKNNLKKADNRSFLARDFESLRSQLIQHARVFFPDKIRDFSEPGLGGLLVDLVASVGDSLSFYLDHEFRELDPMLAVEMNNILTHLKNSGVDAYGASPASVMLKFTLETPAEKVAAGYRPQRSSLPVVLQGTTTQSYDGITFVTLEDLDFAELDINGNLVCDYKVIESSSGKVPITYEVHRYIEASSGLETTESIDVPNTHVPFREMTLTNDNISSISDIKDSEGNEYYEVTSLSQDTVFKAVNNINKKDGLETPSNLEIIPAPRRFVKTFDPSTRLTTIRFGSGNADVLDDDIIPDPSDLALSLYGKKYISRFSIDPNSLLGTQTLGMSPKNTTINVRYRYGGGVSHNVGVGAVSIITQLELEFRNNPESSNALPVRQSIKVKNDVSAVGGSNAPTVDDLRSLITSARASQSRVVTREDLLARVYTMPSTFGRVYRASIASNPTNPLSAILYIISIDRNGNMTTSSDTLKKNLSKYLNEFRLISDALDILDGQVINIGVKYGVVVAPNVNKIQIIQSINQKIAQALQKKFFQIDQPFIIDDISNIIINTDYVISLSDLRIFPRAGPIEDRSYSSTTFPFDQSTKNGIIFGPPGSIFEMKFPNDDIIGSAM
jgi:hypothetical protein